MKENILLYYFFFIILLFTLYVSSSSSSSLKHHLCSPADSSLLLHFKNQFYINESLSSICEWDFGRIEGTPFLQPIKKLYWDEGSDCCKWEGVTCDTFTGHVIALDLSCSNLQGSISANSTLFQLHHLQTLNLAFNDFSTGSLPHAIGSLTGLTHLNISWTLVSGTIPSEISQLSKLVSLDLSYSFERNYSSDLLFLHNLTKLEVLSMSNTGLACSMPRNISAALRYLDLSASNIIDSLPDNIFQLPKLESLILWENRKLVGSLPKLGWNCNQTLQVLDLEWTSVSGELPNSISNLKFLRSFMLTESSFSGFIPESIGNLTHLKEMDFTGNKFSGSVPLTISNLNQLTYLDLSNNHFEGEIPDTFSNLPLILLYLDDNEFSGPFPSSFVNLTRLKYYSLAGNSVIGPLPSIMNGFQKLQYLYLSRTTLNGTIPPWVFSIPSLLHLDLSYNQFRGKLPEISNKSSLEMVDLSNNQLDGLIPHSISNLLHARVLNFASNNFSGEVATEIFFSIKNLSVLNLQSNQLQGPLGIAICNLSALEFLILKNNKLNGTIPQCLGEHYTLSVLDLGMNNFNWIFPTMFAKGNSLTTIALNGNQLRGPVPRSLVNCSQLEALDLGNNKLQDTFPKWLGNLLELQVLVLRSNRLYGPITSFNSTIWFPKLQIFDLSCNSFTGVLPKYFFNGFKSMVNVIHESQQEASYLEVGHLYDISINLVIKGHEIQLEKVLTMLTTIDLSSNQLEGEIPMLIGNLNSLILLNLSHNCLNGSIPQRIGNLTLLESLDISWNQLVGKIPEQITHLTFLEVLNLSQNYLIGHIPRSNQFNTFGNDSYGGNLNLCGFPLSRECNDNTRSSHEHQQHVELEDKSDFMSGFTWRVVLIGFCCGVVFGILMEHLMSRTGKPKWMFVTFYGNKIRKIVPRKGIFEDANVEG